MKRRVLAVVVLVLVIVFAANMIVFAVPSEDLLFAVTFERSGEPDVGSQTVTYQVVLTRDEGSDATASLIDLHLAVTGGYDIATGFTAMNESGVMVAKQDEETNTLRLYRLDMAHPLEFTDNRIVLGTLTLSADGNGTVGLAHDANFSTGDYVASDGVTSPGHQDSLLASVGSAEYTFPQGVTVSGTATAWNSEDDARYYLYPAATEDAVIKSNIKSDEPTGTVATDKSTPTLVTGTKHSQTFCFDAVAAGEYKLAVYKPGGYVVSITSVTVESENVTQDVTLYLLGDVNGNGSINALDLKRLLNHINGTSPLPDSTIGDVNENGTVNALDMKRLLNHINGTNPLN